jgi:predicted nucleic acid-binding protein
VIVLDTRLLVYAIDTEHPLRELSRRLVDAIAAERLHATTTVEVIQEFVHVRARRQGRASAAKTGRSLAERLAPLLVTEPAVVDSVFASVPRLPHVVPGTEEFERLLGA